MAILVSTIPKFAISQSEALTPDVLRMIFLAKLGYGKYLIVSFWYALVAYQTRLDSQWVFTSRQNMNHASTTYDLRYTCKVSSFKRRMLEVAKIHLKLLFYQTIPECPCVSTAVPKNSTYSVTDACNMYTEPIQPPAFINSHSLAPSDNI